jgi:methylmalonyl-CoA/ethylmalonyl-CoA epimerase
MITGIEHIGVAVSSLEKSEPLFEKLLGKSAYKREKVDSEAVITSFYDSGNSKIELLESENEQSAISRFISKRGEGIHHIALSSDDILKDIERLKGEGFQFIDDKPKAGADGKLIVFLHPKSTNGVLIEICQDRIK